MKMNDKIYQWLDESDGRRLALRVAVIASALGYLLMHIRECHDSACWVALFAS